MPGAQSIGRTGIGIITSSPHPCFDSLGMIDLCERTFAFVHYSSPTTKFFSCLAISAGVLLLASIVRMHAYGEETLQSGTEKFKAETLQTKGNEKFRPELLGAKEGFQKQLDKLLPKDKQPGGFMKALEDRLNQQYPDMGENDKWKGLENPRVDKNFLKVDKDGKIFLQDKLPPTKGPPPPAPTPTRTPTPTPTPTPTRIPQLKSDCGPGLTKIPNKYSPNGDYICTSCKVEDLKIGYQ